MKKAMAWLLMSAITMLLVFLGGCSKGQSSTTKITLENCTQRINVSDHGIVAESSESAKENTERLNRLISSSYEGTAICFDKGNYYFEAEGACINITNKKSLLLCGKETVIINASFDPTTEVTQANYHEAPGGWSPAGWAWAPHSPRRARSGEGGTSGSGNQMS